MPVDDGIKGDPARRRRNADLRKAIASESCMARRGIFHQASRGGRDGPDERQVQAEAFSHVP
jgi:hypothetical protein